MRTSLFSHFALRPDPDNEKVLDVFFGEGLDERHIGFLEDVSYPRGVTWAPFDEDGSVGSQGNLWTATGRLLAHYHMKQTVESINHDG